MDQQETPLQFFDFQNELYTAKEEVAFKDLKPFDVQAAASIVDFNSLDNVSKQIIAGCDALTVYTKLDALRELVQICVKADTQMLINWINTMAVVEICMEDLCYREDYTSDFITTLLKDVAGEKTTV